MKQIKLSEGDSKMQQAWLEQHRGSQQIIYDTASGLPAIAAYINPIYQAYVVDPKAFFLEVAKLMDERKRKEQS